MKPRTLTFALGAALIIISNAVALTGVALNRSGEPESRVSLSQRELLRPWNGHHLSRENTSLVLNLDWRVANLAGDAQAQGPSHGGAPGWLDEQRMAGLGFDIERIKRSDARRAGYLLQSQREVLVVLELAGPAWERARDMARQRLLQQQTLLAANPGAKDLIQAEKRAREVLQREEEHNSRLFAVDVGTHLADLRAKYPDRSRYLVLKGTLRPMITLINRQPVLTAYLGGIDASRINVPHALRGAFEAPRAQVAGATNKFPPLTAVVAIGARLEPWIDAVTAH